MSQIIEANVATFEDFQQMEVTRSDGCAEIVMERVDGRPIRLLRFKADAALTDFEVLEHGYEYYLAFVDALRDA